MDDREGFGGEGVSSYQRAGQTDDQKTKIIQVYS